MSGTGDGDNNSIFKKAQLTEFLIWAGPLEKSGFLTGIEYVLPCYWKAGPGPVATTVSEKNRILASAQTC